MTQRNFNISSRAKALLCSGRIIDGWETPEDMIKRVVSHAVEIDKCYFPDELNRSQFEQDLADGLYSRIIVPSTPILTNAGRKNTPLSACSVPPVALSDDLETIKTVVDRYHEDGMGTGFDLNEASDPIEMLFYLNKLAVDGLASSHQRRPVGNMGILTIDHPCIEDFIDIKQKNPIDWKFNLSVNITDSFMDALFSGNSFFLTDGKKVDAEILFDKIAHAAHACGDPGLVFLDNLNSRNPLRFSTKYVSTAPCGEVGLSKGETCQFVYINLAECIRSHQIDYGILGSIVPTVLRFADNALQHSISNYVYSASKNIMGHSRKIGIGICGYSDLLLRLNLAYGSPQALALLGDVLSFINYHSKHESIHLAETRGPFGGFIGSTYKSGDYLSSKFGQFFSSTVSGNDWSCLDKRIAEEGLRNSTTVILPPTGRSALVFDTSQQIEPIFSLYDRLNGVHPLLRDELNSSCLENRDRILSDVQCIGSVQHISELDAQTRLRYRTAIEIPPAEHFNTLVIAQRFSDEGVSKTINLPEAATPDEIKDIYLRAYHERLNGITIYRDGSNNNQPVALK